jgi:electron transfer flavoprotein beta subunit
VSIGVAKAQETLRTALAMGLTARSWSRRMRIEPLAVAKILKAIANEEAPDLVILGKQAIDDDLTRPARCWPHFSAGAGDIR